jgi:hypothetical protein
VIWRYEVLGVIDEERTGKAANNTIFHEQRSFAFLATSNTTGSDSWKCFGSGI